MVSLPNIDVVEDFLPLKLGCTDVILGMKCLETLGRMELNWGTLTMHFKAGGETIVLQGDPSLDKTQVTLKSSVKTFTDGEQEILLELGSLGNPWRKYAALLKSCYNTTRFLDVPVDFCH